MRVRQSKGDASLFCNALLQRPPFWRLDSDQELLAARCGRAAWGCCSGRLITAIIFIKTSNISDAPIVRKYGVRGARLFARLWFSVMYVIAVALFMIFFVAGFVHDFIANDPIHYFAQQPARLLWVAAIAIGGGLITLAFSRLSPRWQRWVKLLASVSAAVCLTALAGYFVYVFFWWSSWSGISNVPVSIIAAPLWSGAGAAFLWFVFYRLTKRRIT